MAARRIAANRYESGLPNACKVRIIRRHDPYPHPQEVQKAR